MGVDLIHFLPLKYAIRKYYQRVFKVEIQKDTEQFSKNEHSKACFYDV